MNPNTEFVDYRMWRLLAWCGPIFMASFFYFWGILAGNLPPFGADLDADQIYAHYIKDGMALRIGMSICMVGAAFYMAWGCAVSRLMQRVEGPNGMLSSLEMMGATITCAPLIMACGIWLTASIEAPQLSPQIVHMMYWLGWMIIDLAYMVTSFQIFAVSIVFLRDKRAKPLMPAWVCWWGFVTFAAFFPVSLIPFLKTGPFAFQGMFNFWIAFFTWYIWVSAASYYVIRGITRVQQEDSGLVPVAKAADGRPRQAGALAAN